METYYGFYWFLCVFVVRVFVFFSVLLCVGMPISTLGVTVVSKPNLEAG